MEMKCCKSHGKKPTLRYFSTSFPSIGILGFFPVFLYQECNEHTPHIHIRTFAHIHTHMHTNTHTHTHICVLHVVIQRAGVECSVL